MRDWRLALLLVLALGLLQSCGGGGDDGDSSSDGGSDFTYTITDNGSNFVVGAHVTLVQASITSCPSGTVGAFSRVARVLITNANGPVSASFDVNFPGAYVESAYIDYDHSVSLSNGDRVLGPSDSVSISAACYSSKAAASSFTATWNQLASQFFGSVLWSGSTMSF